MPFIKNGRGQPLGMVELPPKEVATKPEKPESTEEKKPVAPKDNGAQHQDL